MGLHVTRVTETSEMSNINACIDNIRLKDTYSLKVDGWALVHFKLKYQTVICSNRQSHLQAWKSEKHTGDS